jgi:hypothetical protein
MKGIEEEISLIRGEKSEIYISLLKILIYNICKVK